MSRMRVTEREGGDARCPYCHDATAGELATAECEGCGILAHVECWTALAKCPTLGCRYQAPDASLAPEPVVAPSPPDGHAGDAGGSQSFVALIAIFGGAAVLIAMRTETTWTKYRVIDPFMGYVWLIVGVPSFLLCAAAALVFVVFFWLEATKRRRR